MKKILEKVVTILGGVAIGFINGFFGSGGGMLCVPLMERVLKEETKVAHASAIIIILPISIASMIMYLINGHFQTLPVVVTSIGVVAGGLGGAFLLKLLPPKIVGLIFALSMVGVGIKMVI